MKRRTYVLILVLIFVGLISAASFALLVLGLAGPPPVPSRAYLEIDLSGPLVEYPETNFWASLVMGGRPLSIHEIWTALRMARVDRRVGGVLIRLGLLECDWAKCAEIRDAILDFRASGKKVYAYIEEAPEFDKEYYLATACDRIVLHPLGWLGLTGMGGPAPFFKNALDKLGVRAEFERVEEYKTAVSPFTETGFTAAHREMTDSLLESRFAEYVRTMAEARHKTEAEVKELIDRAFFQGDEAVQAGLVDDLFFDDQVLDLFTEGGRRAAKISLADYSRVNPASLGLNRGRRIALIYGQGPIHGGQSLYQTMGSATVVRWLRTVREDASIAAVVFRIDSPGGSAVASDAIWREVALCRARKPVVISMSDLAGSGGYWIAMPASKIVAQPQTLTGSIGVLAGKFDLSGLFAKLGITSETIVRGRHADFFSPFRSMTDEERALLKKQILWIYDRFLTKAAEGRGMPKEAVDKIGKGRVWTGRQAKDLGLVDEIGGLSKAIALAKSMAGIEAGEEVNLAVWPRRARFLDTLLGRRQEAAMRPIPAEFRRAISWAALLDRDRVWAVMSLALGY
jgi:protease-4